MQPKNESLREAWANGHERGQRYVDTGVCAHREDFTYGCPDGCATHDCTTCGAAHAHVVGPHACPSCGVRFPDLYVSVVSADYYRHPREDRTVSPGPCHRCGLADGAIVERTADGWACHDRTACDSRSVR